MAYFKVNILNFAYQTRGKANSKQHKRRVARRRALQHTHTHTHTNTAVVVVLRTTYAHTPAHSVGFSANCFAVE